ncbi:hypothetical protein PMF13cell1_05104 [Blautia producta]|uniref:Uncharacterized protein n=1 Tax=Blautia producta TaxID=33035 RepID=A0A4P6M7J6_9FIRM|nr:hypothetical protein [Blautia producta]QBE99527.1 hypothetical protein PMF13cell1_05104 [Blautia producta]
MRGGDFFIHVENIRDHTPEGWIMNPNYCEILRFHDFGDMLLKINLILTYLEIRGEKSAELPEYHSLQDCGFGKNAVCFYLLQVLCIHSIIAGRGSSGEQTADRRISEVRWKRCA